MYMYLYCYNVHVHVHVLLQHTCTCTCTATMYMYVYMYYYNVYLHVSEESASLHKCIVINLYYTVLHLILLVYDYIFLSQPKRVSMSTDGAPDLTVSSLGGL